jgi:hypothetical protein
MTTEQADQREPGRAAAFTGRSESIGELAKALAAVQTEAITVVATETATVRGKTKDGRDYSYDYSYADLADVNEAILPKLGGNGLAFVAWTQHTERGFALVYQLVHESNEWIGGEWLLPKGDAQTVGSEITYARRYCLSALTGVAAKGSADAPADDDGRLASARYDDRRSGNEQPPAAPPRQQEQTFKTPEGAALNYLASVVRAKGLDESLVPQAYYDWSGGIRHNEATAAQIQEYTDFVQRTGMLAKPEDAPAAWGGPPTGDTAEAVQDAAAAAADRPESAKQADQ